MAILKAIISEVIRDEGIKINNTNKIINAKRDFISNFLSGTKFQTLNSLRTSIPSLGITSAFLKMKIEWYIPS